MVTTRRAAAIDAFAASHPNGHPTFLTLPLELRLQILEYTFTEIAIITRANGPRSDGNRKAWIPPPILQSCRQLRLDGMKPFRSKGIHFDMRSFDAKQMIAYHEWLAMMKKCYPKNKNFLRAHGCTWIRITMITNISAAKANLWAWVEAFYCNDAPGYFRQQDDNACRTQGLFRPFLFKDELTQNNRNRYLAGQIFLAADLMKAQGVEWNKARVVLEPSFSLAFDLM